MQICSPRIHFNRLEGFFSSKGDSGLPNTAQKAHGNAVQQNEHPEGATQHRCYPGLIKGNPDTSS